MPRKTFYRSASQLVTWSANLAKTIAPVGKSCGLSPAEIKTITEAASDLQAAVQADEQARAAWRASVARTAALKQTALPTIDRLIAKMRTSTEWSADHEHTLMLTVAAPQTLQPDAVKPKQRLSLAGGKVRLDWTRGKLDGVNVYTRRRGESDWRLLERDNRPPYLDSRPLFQPGVPEVREYRLIGVWHDQEVGVASDVASITVG